MERMTRPKTTDKHSYTITNTNFCDETPPAGA